MHVVLMVMPMRAEYGLSQILNIRKGIVLGGIGKIGGQLVQFGSLGRVAIRGGRVGCILQVGRNLGRHLLVFGRIGLLQLLQRA